MGGPVPLRFEPRWRQDVPSLIRFIVVCGVLAGLVYGGMVALTLFVEPEPREMRVKIPSKRLNQ